MSLLPSRIATSLVLSLAACAGPNSERSVTLPVTRVVLYQNGVGYFERRGSVEGNTLSLRVKPSQVNDFLKSLTVIDTSGGRAVSVSLPLAQSGRHLLAELPEQVRNAGGLLAILQVFRGARVIVEGEDGKVEGRIAGLEQLPGALGKEGEASSVWRLTLKTEDDALVVYDVAKIESVRLFDASLAVGLDKSLDVSLDEGQWKPVSISVQLAGDSSHDLIVSYIAEMPLWKPAYRLVVDDEAATKVLVQGWAVIDNVSGEDWRDAKLSLVAGQPMSFQYNLHAPRTKRRLDLTPSNSELAAAPIIEESGIDYSAPAPMMEEAPSMAPSMAPAAPSAAPTYKQRSAGKAPAAKKRASKSEDYYEEEEMTRALGPALESQVQTAVQATQVGALFRYDLQDPINVPDGSSTLVSIINERVSGREVVLFRPEEDSGAPYRAVVFTNDSKLTMEKGPVAIYVGGTFAGEGFVPHTAPGTTGFVTFALDSGVSMKRSDKSSEEEFRLLRIVNGVIETSAMSVVRTTYEASNKHGENVTAFVKTGRRAGWTLRNKPQGTIETPDAIFVPVSVAARQTSESTIEWTSPIRRSVAIDTDASTQVLRAYLGSGKAPAGIVKVLEEILRLKARFEAIATEERELTKQRDTLQRDSDRLRANIDLLRKTPGNRDLMQSLVEKLAKIEEDLGRSSSKLVRFSEERAELSGKMTVLISQVKVEDVP